MTICVGWHNPPSASRMRCSAQQLAYGIRVLWLQQRGFGKCVRPGAYTDHGGAKHDFGPAVARHYFCTKATFTSYRRSGIVGLGRDVGTYHHHGLGPVVSANPSERGTGETWDAPRRGFA